MTWSSCLTMSLHCLSSNLVKVSSLLPLYFSCDSPLSCCNMAIPKQQVIGKLAGGVESARGLPTGLLGCESIDCHVDGNKPVGLIVGSVQLVQQEAAQRRRRLLLVLCARESRAHQNKNRKQDPNGMLHQGCSFDVGQRGKQTHSMRIL